MLFTQAFCEKVLVVSAPRLLQDNIAGEDLKHCLVVLDGRLNVVLALSCWAF
jgi:hypothetical protein